MPSFETIVDEEQRKTVARISRNEEEDITVKRSSEIIVEDGDSVIAVGTLRTNRSRLTHVEVRGREHQLPVYDMHHRDGEDYLYGPVGVNTPRNPREICRTGTEPRVLGRFERIAELDGRRRPIGIAYEEVDGAEAETVMEEIRSHPRKLPEYSKETGVRDGRPGEEE